MFSSFQALLCVHGVRPRDRRTINDAKKFPPLHVPPSGRLYQVN
jgi:hypothetical protein